MRILLLLFGFCVISVSCKTSAVGSSVGTGAENDTLLTVATLTEAWVAAFPGFAVPLMDTDIKDFLKFEFIDKKLYDRKRKDTVDFLEQNELLAKKEDSILVLPSRNVIRVFVDDNSNTETNKHYDMLGEIPFLNRYVVSAMYYEDYEVKLIEKTTGEELTLRDYPCISADRKHLLTVFHDDYSSSTEIDLYRINGQTITNVLYASIGNWQPAVDEDNRYYPMFFASDNYFYLAIRQTESGEGIFEGNYRKAIGPVRYVRLRVIDK